MSFITSQFDARRVAALGLALLSLSACRPRIAQVPAPPNGPSYYIDLQPGWRLRVVTPILKSGGYQLKTEGEAGSTVLQAGPDFLGYEVAWYSVGTRGIEFTAAEVHKDSKVIASSQPIAPLFRMPPGARYVRLIYLVRVSEADHDMAIVAAHRKEVLGPLTAEVRANPEACRDRARTFCSWIPNGIAVTPEVRSGEQWVAAF